MRSILRLASCTSLIIFFAAGLLPAAQQVRVVSDLSQVNAEFKVEQQGLAATAIEVDLPAIAVNSVELNGIQFHEIQLPTSDKLFQSEETAEGQPAVPSVTSIIAIPDQAGVNLHITYSGYDEINDIYLAPAQPATLESGENLPDFTMDQDTYSRDEFYPGDLAIAGQPAIMRDVRFVTITMYPVQYNPARRQLRVYRDLSVSVSYDGEVINPRINRNRPLSDGFYPIYKAMISNFDQFYSTAQVERGGYMIISKPMFIDSLRALVSWKHRKGYAVRVVSANEINPNGQPTNAQIFNYIQDAYENWDMPPEYVMIVGDQDNLTSTGINDYPYDSYYASDQKYACVDGSDYLADIFVARMSIDNMTDFRKAVSKIMTYETHPFMGDSSAWLRGLSVAGNVYAITPRLTTLWVRQVLLRNGFTQVDTSFRSNSGDVDPTLQPKMNQGNSIISYRGWAGSDGWWCPSFRIANLNSMPNNQRLGVMASLVCGTGDFADECFGETWIRMGYSVDSLKGGPCFYGVTDHGTHTRWNNPIMVGYYWGIFSEEIYHFAAAAVRGKLQQYWTFPRNQGPGDYVELYHHTYNMLGDPELEIRTTVPKTIYVEHFDTLGLGINHLEISVNDGQEYPIAGAFVTLVKGDSLGDEVFEVGRTDDMGQISLSFDASTTGQMFVTVSGRNLIPYQGHVEIISADVAVGFDSLAIDDDNNGRSSGNGDGIAEPDEIIELSVALKNFGTESPALGVQAILEAIDDELATVYEAQRNFGDLTPGQSVMVGNPFVIHISKNATEGDIARLKVTVTDQGLDNWYSVIEIPIVSPKFSVTGIQIDGDGRLDPGETANVTLTIANIGTIDASGVSAEVITDDDYTTVAISGTSFGDVPADSSRTAFTPVTIMSESGTFDGRTINMILRTRTEAGAIYEAPFSIIVGTIASSDPIGPDAYGYYMYDNTDIGYSPTPTYQWVELAPSLGGPGDRVPFSGGTDDNASIIRLPFDFIYYGRSYRDINVCTNGFIALDTATYDLQGHLWNLFFNWPIPDPGNARGQISPFWDDLQYTGSNYGVFIWNDTTNHLFYIEYYHMTHRNTSAIETFQIVLTDPSFHPTITGDSEILFHYQAINNNDSEEAYSSVGFESWDERWGLQYEFDNDYSPGAATLAASRAIKISTNTGRGGIMGNVDLANGGQNGNVRVFTTDDKFRMTSQDGNYWIKNIPPGVTDVTAEITGYFPAIIESVTVSADETVKEVDFDLVICPTPESLIASENLGDRIVVTWHGIDHQYLSGYNIYRARWINGEFEKLNGAPIVTEQFIDVSVPDSGLYWYYITEVFGAPGWAAESFASNKDFGSLQNASGAGDNIAIIPDQFFLAQNYPNPFNPSTTISYGLASDSKVKIDIFNVMGQMVRSLVNENQKAGYKSVAWNGVDNKGQIVASGIYFYRLEAGNFRESRKMLMMK